MNKETIYDLKPEGKTVYVRVDYNVPHDSEGHILDDRRIRATIPTIRYLLDHGAAVVLASHMGRPKGTVKPELSLAPCAKRLSELLHQVFRIPVMEYMDPFSFDNEVISIDFHFLAETAVDGIILQKIGSCFHAAGVVDGHHFQVIPVQHAPEYQSSDSAKSVNTNFCHVSTLLFLTLFQPSKIRFHYLRLRQ
jgi:hypothetical protein